MRSLYAIASQFGGPGIGTTSRHAAEGLFRAGHLAQLMALGFEKTPVDAALQRRVRFWPDGVRRFVGDAEYFEKKNRHFDKAVRDALSEGFDTFHAWNSQASEAVAEAKRRGLRVVIDRASTHIRTQTRILAEGYARYMIPFQPPKPEVMERCLADYDNADLVTVPSDAAFQSFLDQGFPRDRLVLNPFGADFREDAPLATQEDRSTFRVLFVGQLSLRKGVLDLLHAWDRLRVPSKQLTLVGTPEPALEERLEFWRGRPDIVFAGWSRDVPRHMAAAHVFCFPSLEEGSALVTYEAMHHGLPMIVTREAGSVAEDEVSALFVKPANPAFLAQALLRLHDDRDLADRLGRAARERLRAYPWCAYGDRTAQTHERLVSPAKSGAA
ncbi:MAG: glycosyltransferase family 4 protein [Deltaproteobacteria bacterium]|nr:glycosyltransferase family 4 protein [Deltaproteobacteria bacterium]